MAATIISKVRAINNRRVFEATVSPVSGNLTMGLVDADLRDSMAPTIPARIVEVTKDTSTIAGSPFEVSYKFEVDIATGDYLMRRGLETVFAGTDVSLINSEVYAYTSIGGPEAPSQLSVNYGLTEFVNVITLPTIAWNAVSTNCNLNAESNSTHAIRGSEDKQGKGLFDPLLATAAARTEAGRNYLDAKGNDKLLYSIKAASDLAHTLGDIIFFANYTEIEEFYGKITAFSYSESRKEKTISLTVEREAEACSGS